jgi:phosphate/phosphite/phosphonate ABC transporter binding protein
MNLLHHFVNTLLASALLFAGSAEAAEYKIGVLAKRGPAKAIQQWGATAEYLTEKVVGDSFVIVPLDFAEVFSAVEKGSVNFFLVNSSMFVTAQLRYGGEAIATMINSRQGKQLKSFGGVILTFGDSDDINDLADIKGKHFMAVQDTSFGGWQMAYKEFVDHGIDPAEDFASLDFGGTHDNVVYAVQNGDVDAGTVRTDTLERMAAAGDIDLQEFKVLNRKKTTRAFPSLSAPPYIPSGHLPRSKAPRRR